MRIKRWCWAVCVAYAGCVFGAPGADPLMLVEPVRDAGPEAGDGESSDDGLFASNGERGAEAVGTDASGNASSSVNAGSSTGNRDAGVSVANGASCDEVISVCDPIKRTGCFDFLGLVCVVDREATQTSGRCVFTDGTADAGVCAEDIVRTTCPAGTGCFDGACRTLCTCDAQCASGACCVGSASPKAGDLLKYCGACP